jgi:acyl-CoA thioesterase
MPKTMAGAPLTPSGIDIYIPFAEKLGVRVVHQRVGDVGLELRLMEDHMNSWQVAHGGVVMSVLDIVMGMSAKTLDEASSGAVTVELKTNFIKAATGRIVARGIAHRAGRSLVFAEADLHNEAQDLLARATGTFKLRYPREESE